MFEDIRLLIMVNWKERGKWDIYRFLVNQVRELAILQPHNLEQERYIRFNRLSIFFSEFYLPIIALFKRTPYDIVISWSMRMGLIYGILSRIFRRGKKAHVIYDFHINPTRKDFSYRFRIQLMRLAIPGIDFFMTTSQEECRRYSEMFAIPSSNIRFFPMSPPRHFLDPYPFEKKDYILSYGNSDRDYDTLINSVNNINARLIILTQNYQPAGTVPPNVTIITQRRVGIDLIELISAARLVVLPLKEASVSAGQTAMLETMALARPLIVSLNPATREYAVHGKTAFFYQSGSSAQLKEYISFLLDNPDISEKLGKRAHEYMKKLVDERDSVFLDILKTVFDQFINNNC